MIKLARRLKTERLYENGLTFGICYRCERTWVINILSKRIVYPNRTTKKRVHYPRFKCPECD